MSDSPNLEQLFQMAVDAARNGQKQGARMMFQQILARDKDNIRVMMWLAKIARNSNERRKWLNRILDVDTTNAAAIKALDGMDNRDATQRNRQIFRFARIAYIITVLVIAAVMIIATVTQPMI